MRIPIVLGLLFMGAEAVADVPIPQDPARLEARRRERLEWNVRTLQGSYDAHGKADPRWDEAARTVFDRAARLFGKKVDPIVKLADLHVPARRAIEAGCDDPMILYLYARSSVDRYFPKPEEYDRRLRVAAEAMAKATCSPYRRAVALVATTEYRARRPDLPEAERQAEGRRLDAAMGLATQSLEQDGRCADWEAGWQQSAINAIALHRRLGLDPRAALERVDIELAKAPGAELLRNAVKGRYFIDLAWESRGKEVAPKVTEEQFRGFESRLLAARSALEAAYGSGPGTTGVANSMMSVEKGIGGDRAAMETWFARAMALDGDDLLACLQKLDWLDPKWHGGPSYADMVAFGRACRATGNWRSGITLLAADAHLRVHALLGVNERQKYMASDEVWDDIHSVFDEYLSHYPDDAAARSKYAYLCHFTGSNAEAKEQFKILGDRLTPWSGGVELPLEGLKEIREQTMRTLSFGPRKVNPAAKARK